MQIRWDGVDIATFEPASLRARIAGVLQEHTSFELTALDNVLIGEADASPAGPAGRGPGRGAGGHRAVAAGHADDAQPAPGQLRRRRRHVAVRRPVATDRAGPGLLRAERDLLVFDEANSRLDVTADAALNQLLHALPGTRLVISHRMHGVRDADLIYLIADGAVAECGTHDELLAAGAGYARLAATPDEISQGVL